MDETESNTEEDELVEGWSPDLIAGLCWTWRREMIQQEVDRLFTHEHSLLGVSFAQCKYSIPN